MNKKDLDILLSKFYNGESTLDEEELLHKAHVGDDASAMLLKALDQMEDEVEVPADLEMLLSNKIDEWEAQDNKKAKVTPLFWKRTTWTIAASIAVIAAVGWWLLRDKSQQSPREVKPPIIAEIIEKPAQNPTVQGVKIESDELLPELPSQPQHKPKALPATKPASAYKTNIEHLAQAKESIHSKSQLSASDEEIALAALEKFSTVLCKGMDQLNNANKKINDINNTIQQHLI